ncbi:hypothetical protein MJM83_30700, partial [Salmonella enterica subsp. enterica serovar Montevideo]|nr:hypothetical protein [Salmonella enterica subsp. enterica serovar Montevideo]
RGRGIEALKLAIDRHNANDNVELVHYAQPLLREADFLADAMAVGFVLMLPLVFTIAAAANIPLLYVGVPMAAALSVTHGFLPPH